MSEDISQLNGETPPEQGNLGIAELLYGVLFTPVEIFRRVADNPPVILGVIIFFVISGLTSLAGTLALPQVPDLLPGYGTALQKARPFFVILGVLIGTLYWLIKAGVLHLIAEFLGGRARSVSILIVIALAEIPAVLMVPVHAATFFIGASFFSTFLNVAGSLAVFFWSLILLVVGLREAEGFSTGRALATLLIPVGLIILMVILLAISFFGIAAPFVMNSF